VKKKGMTMGEISRNHRVKVLDVGGDLNAIDMVRIKNRLNRLLDQDYTHVVLDLRKARHADFTGICILVERARRLRGLNGDVKLAGLTPAVMRVFRQTGAIRLFQAYDGIQAAIQSFKAA
jgi:anti-sigma B factor antagonist